MARSYTKLFTSVWADPNFRALQADDQRSYLMLISQPNLSNAGLLPLTWGRWARLASDSTAAGLRQSFKALQVADSMVVVDEDTEELLVRSFVRHDEVWRQPKRFAYLVEDIIAVESRALQRVLGMELTRLDFGLLAKVDKMRSYIEETLTELSAALIGDPDTLSDEPRDTLSHTLFLEGRDTLSSEPPDTLRDTPRARTRETRAAPLPLPAPLTASGDISQSLSLVTRRKGSDSEPESSCGHCDSGYVTDPEDQTGFVACPDCAALDGTY